MSETPKIDSFAGKEFTFSRVEKELLDERVTRADKLGTRAQRLRVKAQRLERQAVEVRSFAVASSYEHACERLAIPGDRDPEWVMKHGLPVGFKILPLTLEPTAIPPAPPSSTAPASAAAEASASPPPPTV